MAAGSDNIFPKVILSEGAAPATPSSGQVKVYAKADGLVYSKDDAGTETPLGGGGSTPTLDTVLAASTAEDIADALSGAAAPDAGNVFATMADVGGGGATNLASDRVSRTAGNVTTTSTTFVDVTGMTITFTTGARRVLLSFTGTWDTSSGSDAIAIDFTVDGTRVGADNGLMQYNGTTPANVAMTYLTDVLSAASHTFKVQFKSVGGATATIFAVTTVTPAMFAATELYAD